MANFMKMAANDAAINATTSTSVGLHSCEEASGWD
jgi:hypothetical protein